MLHSIGRYIFLDHFWAALFILRQCLLFADRTVGESILPLCLHCGFYLFCGQLQTVLSATTLRLRIVFIVARITLSHAILFEAGFRFIWYYVIFYYFSAWLYLRILHPVRYVLQIQHQNSNLVQIVREKCTAFIARRQPPRYTAGNHKILAAERRECERFVIEECIPADTQFRQPGANRIRFPEFRGRMHVCRYPFEGKDWERAAAGNRFSERQQWGQAEPSLHAYQPHMGCNRPGECCPKRYELPYCLLSHVDYHLTKDQLCEMVTGPTFLVRHRMRDGNVGISGNNHEANIRIIGDYCHMEVSGGQSYYHPFIDMGDSNTDTEGTVVGKSGAFNWSLLGTTGSTSIYYCFPHYGLFASCDDPNVYERQNRRVYINRDGSATCFSTTSPPSNVNHCTVPAEVYSYLRDHLYYDSIGDGNLHRAYTFVHNVCRNRCPEFKYASLLTEAILYKCQQKQFLSNGDIFRLENMWDLGWVAPLYGLLLKLDQKLWQESVDEFIDEMIFQRRDQHPIFNFLFRQALIKERRFNRFDEPTSDPPTAEDRRWWQRIREWARVFRRQNEEPQEQGPVEDPVTVLQHRRIRGIDWFLVSERQGHRVTITNGQRILLNQLYTVQDMSQETFNGFCNDFTTSDVEAPVFINRMLRVGHNDDPPPPYPGN